METFGNCPGSGYGDIGGDLRGRFGMFLGSCGSGVYGEDVGESVEEMDMSGEDDE